MRRLSPGATIGILGGGQLGRMTAHAAQRLGYRVHVYTPEHDAPASQVATASTVAEWDDAAALDHFASQCDVVTLEFENIDVGVVERVGARAPVYPSVQVLATGQDRVYEKQAVNDAGIATAPWREVRLLDDLRVAVAALGTPAILKTARFGYDGKGQARIDSADSAEAAWSSIGTRSVLEGYVDFVREVSVIAARGADGQTAAWDVTENVHRNHILHTSRVPAEVTAETADRAFEIAVTLATKLGVIGLLAVEMFVLRDGSLMVNELAPRPHNSGHWTMDGAATCQFEQLVRCVCGLPLGPTTRLGATTMTNLIGDDVAQVDALLATPGARLHLYGKREPRPGRKMGHVNRVER